LPELVAMADLVAGLLGDDRGLLTRNRKDQRPLTGRPHGWNIVHIDRWRG
jgi:hypothetical protein